MPATNQPCSQHYTSRITGFPPARYGLGISPVPTLATLFALAGPDWHHSGWGFCKVIAAGATEVHLDVQFTRYRADKLGDRLLWLVVDSNQDGGRWAVAARSNFLD